MAQYTPAGGASTAADLKGHTLCRRLPLSGRGLCGGGYVFLRLDPRFFLHRVLEGMIDGWSFQRKIFVRKLLQQICFSTNRFFGDARIDFRRFLDALENHYFSFLVPWSQA